MRLLVLLLVVQLVGIALARVTIPIIYGEGRTSADPLLTIWANSFYNASQGHAIAEYNTTANATVVAGANFIASENPNLLPSTASYPVPATVYGVTVVYSFNELDGTLNLTANIIAGILTGRIRSWMDQSILDANPGITVTGDTPIRVVLHNDSSETYALTNYLSNAASNWTLGAVRSIACPAGGNCVYFSNTTAVLQAVNKGANSIGFVLLGSAVYSRISRANVQNANGLFVFPDVNGLTSAANSTSIPTSGSPIAVVNAPGNYSYPIVGLIYIYVPQDITNLGSQGTATLAFVDYILNNATQSEGAPMFFYSLPSAIDSYALNIISNVNTNQDQNPSVIWPGVVPATPTSPATQAPTSAPTSATSTSTTTGTTTTRNFAGATACSVLAAISFVACVAYDLNRRRLAGLTLIENDIYK